MEDTGDQVPKESELRRFISRDLVLEETGALFRGSIKRVAIEIEEDSEGKPYKMAAFYVDWVAALTNSGWVRMRPPDDPNYDPEMGIKMADMNLDHAHLQGGEDGVVKAHIPHVGHVKILKAGDNLSKEEVQDFEDDAPEVERRET